MKTVLMVAEKPSLAASIAKILSRNSCNTRKGLSSACSVHEYPGDFQGQSAHFKVTSVCGHVMCIDFEGKYNNWEKVDPSELFHAPTFKKEANPKLNIPKFLEKEAKDSDIVVLWLDCDKEGENICFEVLDIVMPVMKRQNNKGRVVYRAQFSSITDKDIHAAMNSLGEPNENESLCVEARQELDLRVGCAFTRFQTKYFQGKYGNLDSSLISYGPCQTPTLGFCVERHDKIQSFKPETYWQLDVEVKGSNDEPTFNLNWSRVRLFDQQVAIHYLNKVKDNKLAIVQSIKTKEKVKQRPQALNTVEMLRVASSSLNIGPQQTMQAAESLYTRGYISYPRTETTHYPENFEFRSSLNQLASGNLWGSYVKKLIDIGYSKPRKGTDVGDHPPITPMRNATEQEIGSFDNWRLYEYIVRHFLATLSPDCKYLHKEIVFLIGEEKFSCTGNSPLEPGFTEIMPWMSIDDSQTLPNLQEGKKCAIEKVALVERKTGPPDYLTESELITLMEKHGIGTDASISTHINNIGQRNYVTVVSGRRLQPTNLGIMLVHGYKKIDADLALPTMRSAVEKQLNLIALGKAEHKDVTKHAVTIFQQKFLFFVQNVLSMDRLFEVTFTPLSQSGKPLSRCGKCRRYMKHITAAPPRLYCSTCDDTYDLPAKTNVKMYKELKCPLDDFELLVCSTGSQGKSYLLCPYCYNHPPFRDMRKGSGCNSCTHPGCIHSRSTLGVSPCISCENGILVLDPTSAPKWKLACNDNRCSTVVTLFQDAHRISVSEDACEKCAAYELIVDFHKEKTPLEKNETKHTGCVFCDPIFSGLIKLKQARLTVKRKPFSTRGRGRGRSRGRGKRVPKDKMSQLAAYFV
ncbi:DNA topoisomerase 3-beta-1-like [Clavelina lepadiformis]|uniref:DNA topoisomerase 3-beta-1-like n=1 Tax=Clavelina lepadiformis TaxID=159417 RepID=UPI0040418478